MEMAFFNYKKNFDANKSSILNTQRSINIHFIRLVFAEHFGLRSIVQTNIYVSELRFYVALLTF